MLSRRLIPAILLITLLAACSPPSPTPSASPTPTRRATHTPAPTATPTVTPTLFPTFTPTATIPPQYQTTPRPEQVVGPFVLQMGLNWTAAGIISHLFAESGEFLWLTAPGGAARLHVPAGVFQQTKFERPVSVLGLERTADSARLWFIRAGGDVVSTWDGNQYTDYGRKEGWILRAEPAQPPLLGSFVQGRSGELWISTDRDIRVFDGERWRVFTATELGMPLPGYAGQHASFVVGLHGEEAWAGACHWEGREPLAGGLRRFDGQRWVEAGLPVPGGCVTAIQSDGLGNVWVGVDGVLWRLDALSDEWHRLPPFDLSLGQRAGTVPEITLAPDGSIWPRFDLCDRTGCDAASLRYHVVENEMVLVRASVRSEETQIVFDGDGEPWLFASDGVYRLADGSAEPVSTLKADYAAADPDGNLWMVTQYRTQPQLWLLPVGQ